MKRAILLVDHGSRRAAANEHLENVASEVRKRAPGVLVATAHMELADPTIAQGLAALARAGASEIVVHPYFLGPGRHTSEDIPRMVEEAAALYPTVTVRVSPPLGLHRGLVDAVLDRVAEVSESD